MFFKRLIFFFNIFSGKAGNQPKGTKIITDYEWTKNQQVLILYDNNSKDKANDMEKALKNVEMICDLQELDTDQNGKLLKCKLLKRRFISIQYVYLLHNM